MINEIYDWMTIILLCIMMMIPLEYELKWNSIMKRREIIDIDVLLILEVLWWWQCEIQYYYNNIMKEKWYYVWLILYVVLWRAIVVTSVILQVEDV